MGDLVNDKKTQLKPFIVTDFVLILGRRVLWNIGAGKSTFFTNMFLDQLLKLSLPFTIINRKQKT